MRLVDVVRFGSIAARQPLVGIVYAQLVQDYLLGETRSDRVYAQLTGSSTRQVTRALQTLEQWGVLTRLGGSRARKLILQPMVNLQWCRDVIEGLYGKEALENVAKGITRAELCPSEGPSDPVANYAVQQVLGLYSEAGLFTYAFPDPDIRTGTGSVVLAVEPRQTEPRQVSFHAVAVSSYTKYVQVLLVGQLAQLPQIATYPVELPEGLRLNYQVTTPKQRAARTRKYETLPNDSFALLYWPMDRIQAVDVANYDTIHALVSYWNEVFHHDERMDRKIYTRMRYLLVEQGISVDKIRNAFKAASIDKFWSGNAVLSSLINDASRIRKLATQNTHDRYGRGFKAIPNQAEVVAVDF